MIEIDLQTLKRKLEKSKGRDELTYYKNKRVGTFGEPTIERRARDEAQQIMQASGAGALFSVYSQLAERYGSLIVLLPVAQQVANQNIAKVLTQLQLVASNGDRIYCLSWFFGVKTADLAQSFQNDAERAVKDIREMLTYALHLIQTAEKEMQKEQKYYFGEDWEWIRKKHNISDSVNAKLVTAKSKTFSNSNADKLFTEPVRIYDYVTSAYARQIADNAGAYKEHQKWQRELLLTMQQDDPADAGGYGMSQSTGR